MRDKMAPEFVGGGNIAIKVPADCYHEVVAFYRDTLGLVLIREDMDSTCFEFGLLEPRRVLWIDRREGVTGSEVWLELNARSIEPAKEYLSSRGVDTSKTVEKLPAGFNGFWIVDPAGTVLLVSEFDQ